MTLKRNFSEFTTEFLNAWKDDPASFLEALFVYVQLLWVTCFPFFGKISQESWRLSFLHPKNLKTPQSSGYFEDLKNTPAKYRFKPFHWRGLGDP